MHALTEMLFKSKESTINFQTSIDICSCH